MAAQPHRVTRQSVTSLRGVTAAFPSGDAFAHLVFFTTQRDHVRLLSPWLPWVRRWAAHAPGLRVWHLAANHDLQEDDAPNWSSWLVDTSPFSEGGPNTPDIWIIDADRRMRWHGSGPPFPRRIRTIERVLRELE